VGRNGLMSIGGVRLTPYVDTNIMGYMSTKSQVNFHASPLATEGEVPFSMTLLVRDTCLCLHVQRAARALARRFDRALKPVGLTNGQFSLLMSLNRPDMPGVPRATVGSVAELLGIDRTTLTAAARVLVRRNLMAVKAEPEDRRSKVLVLTPEGRRALAQAVPIWTREHEAVEMELGAGGANRFRKELGILCSEDIRSDKRGPVNTARSQ
jgi:DNA-binding MarR family transcriptional regulator